ncbi:MAG: hypothetical protein LBB48_05030 [Treponema sp.]|jgi:hypothetical protein|nr:hypothetical protein [Treponema sp.]
MASYLTRGESWTDGSRTMGVLQLCLAALLFITLPLWKKSASQNGKEAHGCGIMPQLADIEDDTPFAIFMNPKRIQHGNRKGIEIKKFDATTESLEYGELFLRFRKRDGFLVTRPAGNMVILKTKEASGGA